MSEENESAVMDRIGTPEAIALAAAREYRGHLPVWQKVVAFVVSPLLLSVAMTAGYLVLMIALVTLFAPGEVAGEHVPPKPWQMALFMGVVQMSAFLPFAVASIVCALLARRLRASRGWTFLACAIVALIAACFSAVAVAPQGSQPGSLSIGLSFGLALLSIGPLVQFLVPLVAGLTVFTFTSRRRLATG